MGQDRAEASLTTGHVVLLGDSIFDNKAYTRGEPDVVGHLRAILAPPWRATLLALDGATTSDVARQSSQTPRDATHVVLSVGGNDALGSADLLDTPVRSSAGALALFAGRVERFEAAYRAALDSVLRLERDTTVCTIYNGNLDPPVARIARIALMTFNDVILRVAFEHYVNVIDLRLVCTEPADYANQIEPSGTGGRKIAEAVAHAIGAAAGGKFSRVFGPVL